MLRCIATTPPPPPPPQPFLFRFAAIILEPIRSNRFHSVSERVGRGELDVSYILLSIKLLMWYKMVFPLQHIRVYRLSLTWLYPVFTYKGVLRIKVLKHIITCVDKLPNNYSWHMAIRFLVCYGITYPCKLKWCYGLVKRISIIVIFLFKYNGAISWSTWSPRSINNSAVLYDSDLVRPIIIILG